MSNAEILAIAIDNADEIVIWRNGYEHKMTKAECDMAAAYLRCKPHPEAGLMVGQTPLLKLQEAKRLECIHNLEFLLADNTNDLHFEARVAVRTTIALLHSYDSSRPQKERT